MMKLQLLGATLLASACAAAAANGVAPVHFSGKIVSAANARPQKLAVFADCQDGRARIQGSTDGGAYRIDLPPGITCVMMLGEQTWDSDPQVVFDARTALPLPMRVYPRQVPEPALARELFEMGEQDSAMRHAVAAAPGDATLQQRLARDDGARSRRLAQIIADKGWPTHSMVGAPAARGAWLVAQHAPAQDLKRWLALMQDAARRHEMNLPNLATSVDRVLVNDGKPQRYGTQFHARADGTIVLRPIEDAAHVDARRYGMGLSSLAQNLAVMAPAPQREAARPAAN